MPIDETCIEAADDPQIELCATYYLDKVAPDFHDYLPRPLLGEPPQRWPT